MTASPPGHASHTGERDSLFDAHHAPSRPLIDDCVHCGFCLPACPTYLLWGKETDSPRGRIHLMKLGLQGEVTMNDAFVSHFDSCLGCMACVTACPSGVQYDRLIDAMRPQLERHGGRAFKERLFRRVLFEIFPYPNRLRALAGPLWLYQRSGLQRLMRVSGLLALLPARLHAMDTLLPSISLRAARSQLPERWPAQGPTRRRVGLLLGCVQRIFFADVNAATARVLAAEGCDVIIPREQGCCGAILTHSGREEEAAVMARQLIDAWEPADVETVVVNAAGCGAALKEYGHLLRDDPQYAERARRLAAKCRDVAEVLAELEPRAPRHPVPLRVAYHDACHLQHVQRVTEQPRRVLRTIPQLEVLDIPESAVCCGSAGIYNLVQPQPARELGDRKASHVISTNADALVSSNPGCLLQLTSSLQQAGHPMPAFHLVELLDASITGSIPGAKSGRFSAAGSSDQRD